MKLLLLIVLFSCTQEEVMFLDKVVSNFDRYSYFIAIDLESSAYRGRVIIENDDLYYYFEQTKQLDKLAYKNLIINTLKSNGYLDVPNINLVKWNFNKVPSVASVTKNAEKGEDEFIKVYFEGRVLKDGISDEERTAIINQLFDWEIPSRIDDETGYLIISR